MKKIISVSLILCLLVLLTGCSSDKHTVLSDTGFYFDTVIKLTLSTADKEVLDNCFSLCEKYEKIFSPTRKDSELYRLNEKANDCEPGERIEISGELYELIKDASEYYDITDGSYDIAIRAITGLWDIPGKAVTGGHAPSENEILEALEFSGLEHIELEYEYENEKTSGTDNTPDTAISENSKNKAGMTNIADRTGALKTENPKDREDRVNTEVNTKYYIIYDKKGISLDPGSAAKGYIADRLKEYLLSCGVESALLNLGGNVCCIGGKPSETFFRTSYAPFNIGLKVENIEMPVLKIEDASVVTSGIYERCFYDGDVMYSHIFDAKTGYPVDNDLYSVSIISKNSTEADCLSTVCFIMGIDKAKEYIDSIPDVFAIFVLKDGTLVYSEGAENLSLR